VCIYVRFQECVIVCLSVCMDERVVSVCGGMFVCLCECIYGYVL
jgi:hypothetical protein